MAFNPRTGAYGQRHPNWKPGRTGGLSTIEHARRAKIAQDIRAVQEAQDNLDLEVLAARFGVSVLFVQRVLRGVIFKAR